MISYLGLVGNTESKKERITVMLNLIDPSAKKKFMDAFVNPDNPHVVFIDSEKFHSDHGKKSVELIVNFKKRSPFVYAGIYNYSKQDEINSAVSAIEAIITAEKHRVIPREIKLPPG